MDKLFVLTFVCFLWTIATCAQGVGFKKLTAAQGLSHNTVYAITQDSRGITWFGTRDGLNQFDGNEIKKHYIQSNNMGSMVNQINAVIAQDSLLYVGTNEGLYIYDQSLARFNFQKEIGKRITRFLVRDRDNIYVGTDSGLFKISQKIQRISPAVNVNAMSVLAADRFLVSINQKLVVINSVGKIMHSFEKNASPEPDNAAFNVFQIHRDPKGRIWLATSCGVYNYDQGNRSFSKLDFSNQESVESRTVRTVFGNTNDELFIGTENGLYVYNVLTGTSKNYTQGFRDQPDKLNDEAIYSTFIGSDGTVWLGTYFGGINYMPPNNTGFANILPGEQTGHLSGKAVSQLMEDSLQRIWIATEDGGISIYNPKTGIHERIDKSSNPFFLSTDNVHALHDDGLGSVWAGTFLGGLHRFNRDNKTTTIYTWDPKNASSLSNNQVYAVFRDSRGILWAGTQRGLNMFDYDTEKFSLFMPSVLGDKFIYDVTEDKNGDLWICTRNNGIYRYNNKTKSIINYTSHGEKARLKSSQIISVYKDRSGQLWFGTLGGGACVYNIEDDSFRYFTSATGLPNNNVYRVLEDKSGTIWLSTNRGISKYDPQSGKIINYDSKHGLSTNQFNFKSSLAASDGIFYFGSINGLSYFDPLVMDASNSLQPLVFTDFQLFNKHIRPETNENVLKQQLDFAKEVNLSFDQNVVTVSYVAIDYTHPGSTQYAYRLDGFEDNWNYVEHNTSATYTNLSPGNYVFRVRTLNPDGGFTGTQRTVNINVAPPFYREDLAYAFYALLIGAGGWGYMRFARFLRDKSLAIQAATLEKEKMASLTQHRIDLFTFISHEFKTPLTLLLASIDKLILQQKLKIDRQPEMHLIKRNTSKLFRLVQQLTEFRKLEGSQFELTFSHFEVVSFVQQIVDSFQTLARQKQLTISFCTQMQNCSVYLDGNKLETILSNLLSNAIKFTEEGTISIGMDAQHDGNIMNFSITDTGAGISSKDLQFIFDPFYRSPAHKDIEGAGLGMSLTANLIHSLQGQIEASSVRGRGTTISFSLPLNIGLAHAKKARAVKASSGSPVILDKVIRSDYSEDTAPRPVLLLVEDDKELRDFLTRHFRENYSVISALNGETAWEKINKKLPDIILSDVKMPKKNGLELCLMLKQHTKFNYIPIVLMSDNQEDDHRINGFDVGADAYIGKPFKLMELDLLMANMVQSRVKLKEHFDQTGILTDQNMQMNNQEQKFMLRLNAVLERLYSNAAVSVEDIAAEMCISRTSLHLNLKSKLNKSAGEVLNSYRLKKALILLSKDIPISEIAHCCGYRDANYFGRVFKKYYQLSPYKYKDEHFKNKEII